MPNHRRFLGNETLVELIQLLDRQPQAPHPCLWTIADSMHKLPYSDKVANLNTQTVEMDLGGGKKKNATHINTGATYSCAMGTEYLVSNGFASCVPVIGVSGGNTYLVHINGFNAPVNGEKYFGAWERWTSVMILCKNNNEHRAKTKAIYDYCSRIFLGGVCIEDVPWYDSTAVVVYRSTCIAYLEDPCPEEKVLARGTAGDPRAWMPKAPEVLALYAAAAGGGGSGGAAGAGAAAGAGWGAADTKYGDTKFGSASATVTITTTAAAGTAAAGSENTFSFPGGATTSAAAAAAANAVANGGAGSGAAAAAAAGMTPADQAMLQSFMMSSAGMGMAEQMERERLRQLAIMAGTAAGGPALPTPLDQAASAAAKAAQEALPAKPGPK